ncbi:MAG: LacI family DNA-binding transcriptional regulator, partial [Sciscionella sp.]
TTNATARALVMGGTRLIGVAIPPVANPYFAALLQAVHTEAHARGYHLLLTDTQDDPEAERGAVDVLRSRRVEGVLLTPSSESTADRGALPTIARWQIPTVLLDRLVEDAPLDQIAAENVQGTSMLTAHLAALGHRRIALLGAASGSTGTERELGYRLGLGRAKLVWDGGLVLAGGSTVEQASATLEAALRGEDPPTAVIAGNNVMLRGALLLAKHRDLRVGTDLAILGYDEVDWAELIDPPLTTMQTPVAALGATAVRMLLQRIATPQAKRRIERLPTRFLHRGSCGCG